MNSKHLEIKNKIDKQITAEMRINFFEPQPKQVNGEVPVYMYWYPTEGVENPNKLKQDQYEFLDSIGPGFPTVRNGFMREKVISVKNARQLGITAQPCLFKTGFALATLSVKPLIKDSLFKAFDVNQKNRSEVEALTRYTILPAVIEQASRMVQTSLGSEFGKVTDAMVFDYTYRFSSAVAGFPSGIPAAQAHVDFTQDSAQKRLELVRTDPDSNVEFRVFDPLSSSHSFAYLKPMNDDPVTPSTQEKFTSQSLQGDQRFLANFNPKKTRIIMLNAWVPLSTVYARPLALCAVNSINRDRHLFNQTMYFDGRIGEVCIIQYDPQQDWYYYPHMELGEVLFLRTWDSSTNHGNWWTPHSGAIDPQELAMNTPRKSVEIRMAIAVKG